ncbi:MAG: glycosyltransferase family 4 protein [Melioribacteraceae bacterium]
MKICFITDSYPPNIGGAEIAIQKIAEGIYERGIDVVVVTADIKDNFEFKSKIPHGKIVRIWTPKFLQRFWFLLFSLPVILLNGKDVDILHGTSYGGIIPAYLGSKLLRRPAVVTVHEFMGKNWKRFAGNRINGVFYQLVEKLFARLSFSMFITVSNYTKDCLIKAGINENKVITIYNGESSEELRNTKSKSQSKLQLGFDNNDYVFAAYGRTGLTKGFEYLMTAIPLVFNRIENAKFLLIFTKGSAKVWKRIITDTESLDPNKVKFFNTLERDKLFEFLNAADSIVIPSLSEGFGFTTLEAGMLGKNIIASDAGSIPEVIHGNYILFEPSNSDAIVEACVSAVEGKFIWSEKKIFSWNSSVENYIKVYNSIVDAR